MVLQGPQRPGHSHVWTEDFILKFFKINTEGNFRLNEYSQEITES